MERHAKIYVAGHTGLVGSALVRLLKQEGFTNIIVRSPQSLDLRNQWAVNDFFATERPEYVFLAAAKVGGIEANSLYPADFIYDNVMINTHVVHAAYLYQVKKLLFFGSSCIYPRDCPQPMKEDYLLSNYLEPTNKPYAVAKIAGITLCQAYNKQYGTSFISCMPTNLYGPYDTFDTAVSHVIPALITKIYNAHMLSSPEVVIWGSGTPLREFLYIDDLAHAALFLMHHYAESEIINVGSGHEISIADLSKLIQRCIGYRGALIYDETKPDGVVRKLLAIDRINRLGWHAQTSLEHGINRTVAWYKTHFQALFSSSTRQKHETTL